MLYHPSRGSVSGNSWRENRWMIKGGQVRNIAIFGSSGPTALPPSIWMIQSPHSSRSCFSAVLVDLKGRNQVVWLCTREKGTTGLPHFLTVALSYIRRDLKSAGGVTVSVGNYSSSLPRVQEPVACCVTGAEPMFRWSDRTAAWSSTRSLLAVATLDPFPAAT